MRGSKLMRTDLFFPVDFSRRPKESKVIKIAHMGMITGFVQSEQCGGSRDCRNPHSTYLSHAVAIVSAVGLRDVLGRH